MCSALSSCLLFLILSVHIHHAFLHQLPEEALHSIRGILNPPVFRVLVLFSSFLRSPFNLSLSRIRPRLLGDS